MRGIQLTKVLSYIIDLAFNETLVADARACF